MESQLLPVLEHEEVLLRRGRRSGLTMIVAVHSTVRGPSLGGCRMRNYDDKRAALRDVLRLSRAMTYKAAAADLPLGGGKGVIALPAGPPPRGKRRTDMLLDFADLVDALRGSYLTAEDVGTSQRDMEVIVRGTPYVTGTSRKHGGSGDPSPATALGVQAAIAASCERLFGTRSLQGRTVCVSGLGHVGMRLARGLLRAGVRVLGSDVDRGKRTPLEAVGGRWIAPDRALRAEVDVIAPCALGAILDEDSVAKLQAPIVAGAANNQLSEDSVAELLETAGVLWAPDFVVNAGGIINISVELEAGGYDAGRARARVGTIAETLSQIYDEAAARRITPLAAAMALAERRLSS